MYLFNNAAISACCVAAWVVTSANLFAIQFIPLVGARTAWDVSSDGTTVVGDSSSNRGYRWTVSGGVEILSDIAPAAVSSDGTVIAGRSISSPGVPAIWTLAGGVQPIGMLPDATSSVVRGISGDGRVVVGYALRTFGPPKAFRWDATTGAESISVVLSGGTNAANAISDDGKVIVGVDGQSAFRWTRESGLIDLRLIGGESAAWGTSADGSIIVGNISGHAFRWSQSTGMQLIGNPPDGASSSAAWDITPDGSTIVGSGNAERGFEALIWTDTSGMQSLMEMVTQSGINLTGWQLQTARGISDNGLVIVGSGTNPQGQTAAWVIIIPEPSTILLASISFAALPTRRRKLVAHNHV